MSNVFEYNGYTGSIEASIEDRCLFGKILFISDLVTYEAETVSDLEAEFIAAVDEYLLTCKETGTDPQRPFKGSFNVRISPELHRKAAIEATKERISLNELTSKAIDAYVNAPVNPVKIEHHHHYEQRPTEFSQTLAFSGNIGEDKWTINPAIMSK